MRYLPVFLRSLRSFTWVSWRYLPGTDISCDLFSKWNIYFSILVFLDPILFSLFLFLCSTFLVFYFLSFSSFFLCISCPVSFSFSLLLCLSFTFFLAAFYLSPLTFFVYHLIFLSASISFFPCWLSSTFILCLSYIIFTFLFSLSFCAFVFIIIIIIIIIFIISYSLFLYFLFFFFCIFYISVFFCLPFLLIFLLFSFSFLFLILFFFPLSLIIFC